MARKAVVPRQPSSFELLARRVQQIICSPRAQVERQANITRLDDESEDDWRALLDQIGEEENVRMTLRTDGSVHLAWLGHRSY